MLLRALQARRSLAERGDGWRAAFIDHVGFTLIALFEGFDIVTAIDLGAPGWVTAALAVLGVIAGNRVLAGVQARSRQPG